MFNTIDRLSQYHDLSDAELKSLLCSVTPEIFEYAAEKASAATEKIFGNGIFIRGLIEFSNYCKNDCYYCGIRRSNSIDRYRLTDEQILSCCKKGYEVGFRTFVLQSGEDLYFNDERLINIIVNIKSQFPDCAITLSIGERSYDSYAALKRAGADRFLLRHETATESHYRKLHPDSMSFENRINCLKSLKKAGFQVGCGIMVGSPFQDIDCLINDLRFMKEFKPHMIGIGPFIPACKTPFENEKSGDVHLTLFLLSILRLMHPYALLPATTALGSLSDDGIAQGLLHGANVVMPNLTPIDERSKYTIYNNKQPNDLTVLKKTLNKIGRHIVISRGDSPIQAV